jgi:hypothetical protein
MARGLFYRLLPVYGSMGDDIDSLEGDLLSRLKDNNLHGWRFLLR